MDEQDGTSVRDQTSSPGDEKTKAILFHAAMKGDWKIAEQVLREKPELVSVEITLDGERMLHIAAKAKCTRFVRELVKLIMWRDDDLALVNDYGSTALSFAAASGVVEIAKVMYESNNRLPTIRDYDGMTPLYTATWLGKKEMAFYLYSITPRETLKTDDLQELFDAAIDVEMFGRKQLISTVLNNIHSFWARVFLLPKGTLDSIEKHIPSFLWSGGVNNGKKTKVAWQIVNKPHYEGRLGLKKLSDMNCAAIMRYLWRFHTRKKLI